MTEPLDPDEFAELKKRVARLRADQSETRWLALHLDLDVQALAENVKSLRGEVGSLTDAVGTVAQAMSSVAASLDRIEARANDRLDKIETTQDKIEMKQTEHDGRFDSTDAQLRSLTMMVGQVLRKHGDDDNE